MDNSDNEPARTEQRSNGPLRESSAFMPYIWWIGFA